MQHYLQLCKQRWSSSMLLLAMLLCFCQGAWAATQKTIKYYTAAGKEVGPGLIDSSPGVIKYTFTSDKSGSKTVYELQSIEPVRDGDFTEESPVDLVIPDMAQSINNGAFYGFKTDCLRSVTFPSTLTNVRNDFMETSDGKYSKLEKLDFTKCYSIDDVKFSSRAFEGCQTSMAGAVIDFNDSRSGLSYRIDISTGDMRVTGFEYEHPQVVVLGQKDLGGLTGRLVSLGGFFKGYTAHEFSLAITDGLKGLEDGALQGSSVTALSLPKSFGAQYFKTSETICGTNFMADCAKLAKVYIFTFNVPYILKRNSGGTYDISYDTSSGDAFDFGVSASAGHGYSLDERDFSYRWPNLGGDIGIVPDFEFPKGTYRDVSSFVLNGDPFKGNTAITGLTVYTAFIGSKRLSQVGNYAFSGCTGLKELTVDTSNDSHEIALLSGCFEGCTSLTDITLGNRVTNVYDYCFKDCSSLKNISLEKSAEGAVLFLGRNCFEGCTSLQTADLRGRTINNLPTDCFTGCSSLTTLMFDHDVQALYDGFDTGTQLNTVYFTKTAGGVTYDYIWTSAESVALPGGETFRGKSAISGMKDGDKLILRRVTDPNAASEISSLTFSSDKVVFCTGSDFGSGALTHVLDGTLTGYYSLTMPYGVEYGDNCFNTSKLSKFEGYWGYLQIYARPSSLSEPGKGMTVWVSGIEEPNDLTALDVPYSVEVSNMQGYVNLLSISPKTSSFSRLTFEEPTTGSPSQLDVTGSFTNVAQLESVTLPEKRAVQVGDGVFSGCAALSTVSLGGCTSIGANAFSGCTSLTAVDLRKCTNIEASAFSGCTSLASVRLGKTNKLGAHCFDGTAIKSLVLKQPDPIWFDRENVEQPLTTDNVLQGIEGLQAVVFEMTGESYYYLEKTLASFRGELAKLTTKPAVYVNYDAYKYLDSDDKKTVGDITIQQFDHYRFMATATSDGEALDKGYGTICLPRAVDMEGSYNVKALYTAQYDGVQNTVKLTPVSAADVQSGQPYIYSRGDDASGLVVFAGNGETAATPLADGALTGTFTATTAPKGSYVLQSDNMFHIVGSTTINVGAYRAYLNVPDTGTNEAKLSIIEYDEPTAIESVTDDAASPDADAPMYNLNGQRITAPVKGQIYIMKGKKAVKR